MKQKPQNMKWLAAFLCCALLWASPVMATNYALWIAGVQVTSSNCKDLSVIDGVSTSRGNFQYDPIENKLTMTDVKVDAGSNIAILNNITWLRIEVSGTNELKTNDEGLACAAPTQIVGNGSLTIVSKENIGVSLLNSDMRFSISDITLNVSGKWGIAGIDGKKGEILELDNAKVIATGTEGAIVNLAAVTTAGCCIVSPEGGEFNGNAVVDKKGHWVKKSIWQRQ